MVLHKCSWTLQCSISTISISNFHSQQPYSSCPFLSGFTSNNSLAHWHCSTFFTIILTISFICLQLLAQFVVRQPQHMQHSRRSGFVSFLPYNFLLVRYRHPTLPSKSVKQCCSSGSIVPNMQFTRLLTIWVVYAIWNWWNRPLTSLLTMWVV